MHPNTKDLTGQRFGKLTAKSIDGHDRQARIFWLCQCDCGNTKRVRGAHLRAGSVKGCGCDRYSKVAEAVRTHGYASGGKVQPIYTSWAQMHARCSNPNYIRWHRYGGRGISVCPQWATFEGFLADMGASWKSGLSIDRIKNDGNYEPGNCRWATAKEQRANQG